MGSLVRGAWEWAWGTPFGVFAYNVLVSLDQLGNVVLGILTPNGTPWGGTFFGDPDETISSVLGRKLMAGKANRAERVLIWALDRLDPGHALTSIERSVGADPWQRCFTVPRENR